jgi:Zn-dependent protease with chaperone function
MNIYFILIVVNWIIYFISGGILDKLLGIKRIKNENLLELVKHVKDKIGISGKVKAGIGKYPILNAMAYGSFFDKRIAIIAEDIDQIPRDELKGIVAHELAHTKGKHTLILTLITTADLIVRMIFGIPATFYDYTFGDPQIPLVVFIILNLIIYIILFVFVRILEGRADLKAKKAGYGTELVKALYNLESFYATGREIGLNTMLLSEEKISKENQLLDYFKTASYLYNSIIKPSKLSLLGNLINSHPPSYYRIAAILGNELKPGTEALLPFLCLKKSIQKKYAKKFEPSRNAFKIIANEKFKEYFQITDISLLLHNLKRKEFYKHDLNKDYLFTNKVTDDYILGHLNDIQFSDDICSSDQFIIEDLKTHRAEQLEKALFSHFHVDLDEIYYLNNNEPLILKNLSLKAEIEDRNYIFLDKSSNQITKPIKKTKLPNSIAPIKDLENKEIFFKTKGTLNIMKCVAISSAENLQDFALTFSHHNTITVEEDEELKYTLKELIIRPKMIYLPISKSSKYRDSERKVLAWLKKNQILIHLYMKKPVNNIEIGYLQQIDMKIKDFNNNTKVKESENSSSLFLKNIFDKEVKIPYDSIESINFEYNSAMIQVKSETSLFSRLGYKILKKFKPDRIVIT